MINFHAQILPVIFQSNCQFKTSNPYGIEVNVLINDNKVHEFKLNSRYYIHFCTNILGKGMNFFIPSAMP